MPSLPTPICGRAVFFGLSDGWWLRLQVDYDTEIGKAVLAKALAKIKPWKESVEDAAGAR